MGPAASHLLYELERLSPSFQRDFESIILATARANNATLWTQDVHFKGLEGVKYVEKKG